MAQPEVAKCATADALREIGFASVNCPEDAAVVMLCRPVASVSDRLISCAFGEALVMPLPVPNIVPVKPSVIGLPLSVKVAAPGLKVMASNRVPEIMSLIVLGLMPPLPSKKRKSPGDGAEVLAQLAPVLQLALA